MATRRIAARILVVLATVVAFAGILAVWANRQILNTDNWTKTSTQLLERPVIRDQVAGFLVDQLYANVDVAGQLRAALPPRLQPLAGPAAGGLRQLANQAAVEALQRPRVQELWANANRSAQETLLKVLEGGGPNVSTQGGLVVLHLGTLLNDLAQRVGVGGKLASAIPPGAADITVLRSHQLQAAQRALKILKALPYVLVGGSLLLFGLALALSPDWRRKALRAYGFGFVIAGALALFTRTQAGDALTNSLAQTAAVRPAIEQGWTISTTLLEQAAKATIFYGIVMIVLAWLAGPMRPAVATRRGIAPFVRDPVIAYAGFAVIVALLLWWSPTPATRNAGLALLLVALLAVFTEVLRRQIGREYPEAVRSGTVIATAKSYGQRAGEWVRGSASSGRAVVMEHVQQRGDSDPAQGRIEALERLGRLRREGVLDDAEFAAQKAELLRGQPATGGNGGTVPATLTPDS